MSPGYDPRLAGVAERLRPIQHTLLIASGKGGVGKTVVATTLALLLHQQGYRVGLLDLDFHGPSCHIVLGAVDIEPVEERGLVPPEVHGVRFMSLVYFVADRATPLRGTRITDAIIELLAITRWGPLNYLIVDLPPGIGDPTLEALRLLHGSSIVVTTPSKLSTPTVARLLQLLTQLPTHRVLGLIENMRHLTAPPPFVQTLATTYRLPILASIPFDPQLESTIGNPSQLLQTSFANALRSAIKHIENSLPPHQRTFS